jgi:hypothetical protein
MEPIAKVKLPALQSGASQSLIILFRYMPLDPAYKAGLARHETGQNCKQIIFLTIESLNRVCFVLKS